AQGCSISVSADSGMTWTTSPLPLLNGFSTCFAPVGVVDGQGNLAVAAGLGQSPGASGPNAIVLYRIPPTFPPSFPPPPGQLVAMGTSANPVSQPALAAFGNTTVLTWVRANGTSNTQILFASLTNQGPVGTPVQVSQGNSFNQNPAVTL